MAAPIGAAALAVEREVFELWHRFRRGELDRPALRQAMETHQTALWRVLVAGTNEPEAKAAGLCRKLLDLWPALWTFVRVEGVEPTNNAAEQALRPAVLWRPDGSGGLPQPRRKPVRRAPVDRRGLVSLAAAGSPRVLGRGQPSGSARHHAPIPRPQDRLG